MSDQSDTSSFNGDWEPINDCSQEMEHEMESLSEEMKKMKMEMDEKDKEIAQKNMTIEKNRDELLKNVMEIEKKDAEIRALRENEEAKNKEIAQLRSKIETVQSTASLEEWMKSQMERMELSSANLKNKTMELYKKIAENEMARAHATVSSERKKRANNIQDMEDLCARISEDVLKNNNKYIADMTSLLYPMETCSEHNEGTNTNTPIESFLGQFTAGENEPMTLMQYGEEYLHLRTIVFKKSMMEGYFETRWKFDNGKELSSAMWIPDNIVRTECRYRIEKNVLIIDGPDQAELRFALTDVGLIFNGLYVYSRDEQQEDNNGTIKNMPIESFLGEFTATEHEQMSPVQFEEEQIRLRTIIIRKSKIEGFFESFWKCDNGKEVESAHWKPDNVERNECRFRIERNVLIRVYKETLLCYELTDEGLKFNVNYNYARI